MLRSILRCIAVVLILLAAVAATYDVQALVAFGLFAPLTGLAAARRRADHAVAERRPAADVACCARSIRLNPWRSELMCIVVAHDNKELAALLRALENKARRPDAGSPKR